jgi:general L-amino acid transport system permease protein
VTAAPPGPRPSWSDPRVRALAWQAGAVALVLALLVVLVVQTAANLRLRGLASGFGFLGRATGFEISASPLAYSPRDSYARALAVGLLNTVRVALLAIVLATALGLVLGIARLSRVRIVATLARVYVEVVRNTPLLLQLLFWYSLSQALPGPRDALRPLPGVFLCIRGLHLPGLAWHGGTRWLVAAAGALAIVVGLLLGISRRQRDRNGRALPTARLAAGAAAVLLVGAIAAGHPAVTLDRPALMRFGFEGGMSLTPEFAALLIGLSTYTAAFIGEIVRGGILAVDRGQTEAAAALGMSRARVLRLVVLPQALRVALPPTTTQYLNLTKNSSLAVAIGYPDLMSIADTTLNQTGQAVEVIALVMTVYLALSLVNALLMSAAEP